MITMVTQPYLAMYLQHITSAGMLWGESEGKKKVVLEQFKLGILTLISSEYQFHLFTS